MEGGGIPFPPLPGPRRQKTNKQKKTKKKKKNPGVDLVNVCARTKALSFNATLTPIVSDIKIYLKTRLLIYTTVVTRVSTIKGVAGYLSHDEPTSMCLAPTSHL